MNKLYLGQLLDRDGVEYSSNNLIKSPTGSGKTHFIINGLNKAYSGKKLLLVSLTSLKDKYGDIEGSYVTQDLRRKALNITDESIYVMTYAEFGHKVKWNRDFMYEFSVVYCDEIHSLFKFYFINKNHNLGAAISLLFDKHEGITIFYFTATTHELDKFIDREYSDLYRYVNIIDYYDNEDIVRQRVYTKDKFAGKDGIKAIIDNLEDFKEAGKKGFIYNERIDGMKDIEEHLVKKGYKVASIWSVNNEERPMTTEQMFVRDYLLKHEVYPKGYDFIIINGAMVEGWNLKDKIELAILNTLDPTALEQAQGRIRGDIPQLHVRAEADSTPIDVRIMSREKTTGVVEDVLGLELDNEMKEELAIDLDIRREENNKLVKWRGISSVLKKNGYKIEDIQKTVDGKRKRFSVITKIEKEVKPSMTSKSSKFLASLADTEFAYINKEFLANYINKDSRIAYAHIKSSHETYVGSEGWSNRKFADMTYLLVRDKKLFSKKNYSEYGRMFTDLNKVDILTERAKYEKAAVSKLKEVENEENQELLDYIAAHGGM